MQSKERLEKWVETYSIPKKHKHKGNTVSVKRSIIGGNTWYITECPECNDTNTLYENKKELKYDCENCGCNYIGEIKKTTVVVAKTKKARKVLSGKAKKYLIELQENCCYWCHREFNIYIWDNKRKKARQMSPVFDHYKAFAFSFNNNLENYVATCPVCNAFKSDMHFEDENDFRQLLEYRWNKALDKKEIEIL